MRKTLRRWGACLVAVAVLAMLPACSGAGPERPSSDLVFSYAVAPRTWDPSPETRAFVYGWYALVYDGLMTTDASGAVVPGLATAWEQTPQSLTLTLRQGVTFADGTPFDAAAVQWNIAKQQAQPGTSGVLKRIAAVEAPNPHTVVMKLAAPAPSLVPQLASFAGLMVSPSVSQTDLEAGVAAGTGPYRLDLKATAKDTSYTFRPNPTYVGDQSPAFATVTGLIEADEVSRTNSLRSGRVDVTYLTPAQANDAEGKVAITSARSVVQALLLLDVTDGAGNALADPKVREAIARGIDRNAFDRAVNFDRSHPQTELLEPPMPGTTDGYDPYPYDPDLARRLIGESGHSKIVVRLPVQGGFRTGGEAIAAMLDQIGVEVKLVSMTPGQDTAAILAGQFNAAYTYVPDANPESIYGKYLSPVAPFNPFKVPYAEAEGPHARAVASELGSAAAAAAYGDMFRAALDSARIIPIARIDTAIGYDAARVSNVHSWSGITGLPRLNDIRPGKG